MFEIGDQKENVPARIAAGCRGIRQPSLGAGVTEKKALLSTCQGCSKLADHEPASHIGFEVPFGEHRQQRIDNPLVTSKTVTAEEMVRLRSALWKAHYLANGVVSGTLYNLGDGANNVSQQATYQVMSINGKAMTIKGKNPKNLFFGDSKINPLWPGIDPETGEPYPRLTSTPIQGAMPVGARVQFHYPSALHRKMEPCVVRIIPPSSDDIDDVTFQVRLSHSANAATSPFDAKYPPEDGKYWCTLFFYFTAAEQHPNYQPRQETQWSPISKTFSKADIDAGPVSLTDSDGGATRVIMPSMAGLWHEFPVRVYVDDGGGSLIENLNDDDIDTTDTGNGWSTTADLSRFSTPTLSEVTVRYWAESTAGDTTRRPWFASCANSQIDFSESYIHDSGTGRRCVNVDCDQFDSFRGECWKPGASKFNVVSSSMRIDQPNDGSWISRFWEDTTLVLKQGIPGISSHRNFSFERVGGPSVGELLGGFQQQVPGGMFPHNERWDPPKFGWLEEYDPNPDPEQDGGTRLRLVHGAYISAEEQDAAARDKIDGVLEREIPTWDNRENEMGDPQQDDLIGFPTGGTGGVNLNRYNRVNKDMSTRCRKSVYTEEKHITGVLVDASEDVSITAEIRDWFA